MHARVFVGVEERERACGWISAFILSVCVSQYVCVLGGQIQLQTQLTKRQGGRSEEVEGEENREHMT